MFIIGWLVILVSRANDVVIPGLVSGVVGWLAIIESLVYMLVVTIQIIAAIRYWRS